MNEKIDVKERMKSPRESESLKALNFPLLSSFAH